MTVRFGLLGAGRIGKVHTKAITSNAKARLVAVADAMPAAAKAIAGESGAEVRTIDAIEKSADIDAVVICTPTDTHADLIERFAKAGKAIFCEKPIDLDAKRVRKCLAVVEKTKGDADGRLQPALRSAFRGRAQGDRRWLDRRGGDGARSPRAIPARRRSTTSSVRAAFSAT